MKIGDKIPIIFYVESIAENKEGKKYFLSSYWSPNIKLNIPPSTEEEIRKHQ